MQYATMFATVKNDDFQLIKVDFFFLFLLKTLIVGTC